MTQIDSTARVAAGAQLGAGVEIGPYCIVGPEATLGDGCRLLSQVHVTGVTTIGSNTVVYPQAVLGTPPQSVHYQGERSRLVIGSGCMIRESVTINTGTAGGRMETRIGDQCFMMAGAHVGHDCVIGNHVTLAPHVSIGGHAEIGDYVFLGGLCAVHQFCRIGELAMIGGLVGVGEDVIPFAIAIGHRVELGGLNIVGLKRRGFSREAIHRLRSAYRMLFFGEGVFADRIERTANSYTGDENVERIIGFLRADGKRTVALPRSR